MGEVESDELQANIEIIAKVAGRQVVFMPGCYHTALGVWTRHSCKFQRNSLPYLIDSHPRGGTMR